MLTPESEALLNTIEALRRLPKHLLVAAVVRELTRKNQKSEEIFQNLQWQLESSIRNINLLLEAMGNALADDTNFAERVPDREAFELLTHDREFADLHRGFLEQLSSLLAQEPSAERVIQILREELQVSKL